VHEWLKYSPLALKVSGCRQAYGRDFSKLSVHTVGNGYLALFWPEKAKAVKRSGIPPQLTPLPVQIDAVSSYLPTWPLARGGCYLFIG